MNENQAKVIEAILEKIGMGLSFDEAKQLIIVVLEKGQSK